MAKTLAHSEEIKTLVEECAEKLTSANIALKQELANQDPTLEIEKALETNEEVEKKVHSAAEQLALVNDALEEELVERARLEHLLVLGKAQEEAALQLAFLLQHSHGANIRLGFLMCQNPAVEMGAALLRRPSLER